MFEQALDGDARAVLVTIGRVADLSGFYLGGGSAVALHYGHRLSHDLDFFTPEPFPEKALTEQLSPLGRFELDRLTRGTIVGRLNGVRLACFHYPYPLLEATEDFAGARIARPLDLGAMKLAAISARGARRDFIDLYWILQSYPLDQLLTAYTRKYGASERALPHLLRSLAYFQDADAEPMPRMLADTDWEAVKLRLSTEAERVGRHLF